MKIAFILTMPNVGSWNGKWSLEDECHAKIIDFTERHGKSEKAKEKLNSILGNFYHNFGDGWGANVEVKEVDTKTANAFRKKSKGFCGYDWMIDSILVNGDIRKRKRG